MPPTRLGRKGAALPNETNVPSLHPRFLAILYLSAGVSRPGACQHPVESPRPSPTRTADRET